MKAAGTHMTVGELRAALVDLDERTPVLVLPGASAEPAGIVRVTATRFLAEIAIETPVQGPMVDLLVEIVEGGYTLRQAKIQAADVLKAAGFEVGE